jgi:hypothetical protein
MRELGRKGGKARGSRAAAQLKPAERASVRQHLRDNLDPDVILAGVQQALAGGNELARVQCIRFLADLELHREGDSEERDYREKIRRETAAIAEAARVKLERFVAHAVLNVARGKPDNGLEHAVAEQLRDQLTDEHRRAAEGIIAREMLGLDVDESKAAIQKTLRQLAEIGLLRAGDADELERLRAEKKANPEPRAERERLEAEIADLRRVRDRVTVAETPVALALQASETRSGGVRAPATVTT